MDLNCDRMQRKATSKAPARRRPEWNAYLTDAAAYQLNQDQLLKKKIQMLTKIPTELPRRTLHPTSGGRTTKPRDAFAAQLRRPPLLARANELHKQELQHEIDRMDKMLASLELQANEFDDYSALDHPPPEVEGQDISNLVADTTTNDTFNNDAAVARESDTHHLLSIVEQLQQELVQERQAREEQAALIQQLQESVAELSQAHATLREDFKHAVKHIVKLKHTVSTLQDPSLGHAREADRRAGKSANQENVLQANAPGTRHWTAPEDQEDDRRLLRSRAAAKDVN
ncbi:hypothetical protein ACHHYP_12849 [Achlya hypogyna]|uniref:Uncharacterized protein n=1 Tax=Achlya hypogyna TaxID=1202772 RepID=A0A1V9ZGG3_ACHHY|nr:hypothetical protein ACHHYP_12849 [Achlya hypogyna]